MNDGVMEAEDCGNGFLLVERVVFETMKGVFPELQDTYIELSSAGSLPTANSWFFFEAMVRNAWNGAIGKGEPPASRVMTR